MNISLHTLAAVGVAAVAAVGAAACTSPTTESEKSAPVAVQTDARSTVTFSLDGPAKVGALQLDVVYPSGVGAFVGERDEVECETLIEGALSSYNHVVGERTLKAAYVAVQGMEGPIAIATCSFQGAPKAADFQIGVLDASTPDLQEIRPLPGVQVAVAAAD